MSTRMLKVEEVLQKAENKIQTREAELFIAEGTKAIVTVDLDANIIESVRTSKENKQYTLYGITVEHEGRAKTMNVFLDAVPTVYSLARARAGKVTVGRQNGNFIFS